MLFHRSFQLVGRKERRVLQLLKNHLDSVLQVVDELKSLIFLLTEENITPTVVETKIKMISIRESFADDIYLKSLLAICDGAFFAGLREDFINLFKSIDDIADHAEESSQILARSKLDTVIRKFYENQEASLSVFSDKIVKSVKALKEAAYELEKDAEEVIKKSIKVRELEEEADHIMWKLLKVVFSHRSEMDLLSLLEMKEFVLALDKIADAAARSSEMLITIVTKARA